MGIHTRANEVAAGDVKKLGGGGRRASRLGDGGFFERERESRVVGCLVWGEGGIGATTCMAKRVREKVDRAPVGEMGVAFLTHFAPDGGVFFFVLWCEMVMAKVAVSKGSVVDEILFSL